MCVCTKATWQAKGCIADSPPCLWCVLCASLHSTLSQWHTHLRTHLGKPRPGLREPSAPSSLGMYESLDRRNASVHGGDTERTRRERREDTKRKQKAIERTQSQYRVQREQQKGWWGSEPGQLFCFRCRLGDVVKRTKKWMLLRLQTSALHHYLS